MANVEYQGKEPTVTVHGVPKSEYDQGTAVPQGQGGGVGGWFKQHWVTIAVGGATLIIGYILYVNYANGSSSSQSAANQQGAAFGSQLDADMQQMMSFQDQEIGLLQQLLNQQSSSSSSSGSGSGHKPGKIVGQITLNPFKKGKNSGKGISVFSTDLTGAKRVSYDPYGSIQKVISGATKGRTFNGSDIWYEVQLNNGGVGWISASDVSNFKAGA